MNRVTVILVVVLVVIFLVNQGLKKKK